MASLFKPSVVVIAVSVEGFNALIRLLHQLPSGLPALIIGVVHGVDEAQLEKLIEGRLRIDDAFCVTGVIGSLFLMPGRIHLISASSALVFTARSTLGVMQETDFSKQSSGREGGIDFLFRSAARIHGASVIGVVLSGRGHDGTQGLLAITEVGGTRIVQTPCEAAFPGMPFHALMHDHVNHSVVLDEMGQLICKLIKDRPQ